MRFPDALDEDEMPMPEEFPTTLRVNGRELVTVQSTRVALADWAYGYLFARGLIRRPADLAGMRVNETTAKIDARLLQYEWPEGSGPVPAAVDSPVHISHWQLARFQSRMHQAAVLYAATGGMHVAALCRVTDEAMIIREDIGRHNAVDKVIGAALLAGWEPGSLVLVTSGRIAHEMARKAALFGIGLVASRSAVTDQAERLGRRLGIAMIGYLRPRSMRVYTGRERLDEDPPAPGVIPITLASRPNSTMEGEVRGGYQA